LYLDNTRSEVIPFTDQAITVLNALLAKKPKMIVQLHNDALPLSARESDYANAFNAFGQERMKRVKAAREKRREAQELEKKLEKTLIFFKDIIHVCQVYCRSTKQKEVPMSTLLAAFEPGAYGVSLPDGFNVINKYLRAAETMGVVASNCKEDEDNVYILHSRANKWKVPIPENISELMKGDNLSKAWQHMMTGLVCTLQTPKIRSKLVKQLTEWGPLHDYSERLLDELIELCIFRGIILMDESNNCMFNTNTEQIPIDYTSFPGYHVAIFASSSSNSKKAAIHKTPKPIKQSKSEKKLDKKEEKEREKEREREEKERKKREKEEEKERGRESSNERGREKSTERKSGRSRSRSRSLTRFFGGGSKDKGDKEEEKEEEKSSKKEKKKSISVAVEEEEVYQTEEPKKRRRSSSIAALKRIAGL